MKFICLLERKKIVENKFGVCVCGVCGSKYSKEDADRGSRKKTVKKNIIDNDSVFTCAYDSILNENDMKKITSMMILHRKRNGMNWTDVIKTQNSMRSEPGQSIFFFLFISNETDIIVMS